MSAPNLISKAERAQFVYGAMLGVQRNLLELGTQQILNDQENDEPVAGMEPRTPGGSPQTYGERKAQLYKALETLWDENEDVQEQITVLAAEQSSD